MYVAIYLGYSRTEKHDLTTFSFGVVSQVEGQSRRQREDVVKNRIEVGKDNLHARSNDQQRRLKMTVPLPHNGFICARRLHLNIRWRIRFKPDGYALEA